MKKRISVAVLFILVAVAFGGLSWAAKEKVPVVGPVKVNAHPANLEGKTVVLRWNGKMNGDKYLTRVGELLSQQVKGIKIIKLWETDKATASISKDGAASEAVAKKMADLKADLVIAAQAD